MKSTKKCGTKYAGGGRIKASVPKHGVTRNGKRRYGCGGKIKSK